MIHHSGLCCRDENPCRCENGAVRPLNHRPNHYSRSRHGQSPFPAWSLLLLCCLLLLPNTVAARRIYAASELLPRELLFDRSEPPLPLVARQESSDTSPSTTIRPQTKTSPTGGSIQTAAQTAAATLPRPFDSSIGTNFTSTTCPDFFNDFLSNPTFNECLPFSLLLQVSELVCLEPSESSWVDWVKVLWEVCFGLH